MADSLRSGGTGVRRRCPEETRGRLLGAARDLVLRRGFTATGVEEICREAGVTKGAFFHHFESKEALGLAVLAEWAGAGMALYGGARGGPVRYALEPVHRFFEIMEGLAMGGVGR